MTMLNLLLCQVDVINFQHILWFLVFFVFFYLVDNYVVLGCVFGELFVGDPVGKYHDLEVRMGWEWEIFLSCQKIYDRDHLEEDALQRNVLPTLVQYSPQFWKRLLNELLRLLVHVLFLFFCRYSGILRFDLMGVELVKTILRQY